MTRVRSASDTCHNYFTYIKVNHLLYTCSLDPFEDGILLDTPLVCMHRYCRSFTDDEEECEHLRTTTPSAREAWKRRRKKRSCASTGVNGTTGQQPVHHRSSGTTGPPPDNYRPSFCCDAVQGRYRPGCSAIFRMTGTTAPATGTTARLQAAPDGPSALYHPHLPLRP